MAWVSISASLTALNKAYLHCPAPQSFKLILILSVSVRNCVLCVTKIHCFMFYSPWWWLWEANNRFMVFFNLHFHSKWYYSKTITFTQELLSNRSIVCLPDTQIDSPLCCRQSIDMKSSYTGCWVLHCQLWVTNPALEKPASKFTLSFRPNKSTFCCENMSSGRFLIWHTNVQRMCLQWKVILTVELFFVLNKHD